MKQYCRLTTEQASLYQVVVDEMLEKIESTRGIERRGNVLAAMAKLKQVCNHPAQLLHDRSPVGRRSGKIIRLEEILEEILAEGDRVLCFTQFTEFARCCSRIWQPGSPPTSLPARRHVEEGARRDGRAFPVRRRSIDLPAVTEGRRHRSDAHRGKPRDPSRPLVEPGGGGPGDRSTFRIGQRRNVEVHKFICTGTLEEKIDDMIEAKKALANLVVSDGEGWLTELSTTELRELFSLSEGAVGE